VTKECLRKNSSECKDDATRNGKSGITTTISLEISY